MMELIRRFCWGLILPDRKMSSVTTAALLLLCMFTGAARGAELIYKPVNPNFGGNPFNDGILLGAANAQNPYSAEREERDLNEQFVRSLQGRLFSGLARQVEDAVFGDTPQDSGTFTVGDQEVSFIRGLETIQLEISNTADGSTTLIEVPVIGVE